MPYEITMPQLSDTMTEGVLVKWSKKEGDAIKSGDELAEVETDKATMPMEAFEAGTFAVQLVKEGDKVPVGQIMGVVASKGEDVAQIKSKYAGGKPAAAARATTAAASHTAGAKEMPDPPLPLPAVSTAEVARATGVVAASTAATPEGNGASGRVKASPLARRIAESNNLDITQLKGTGPDGRIVQKDVLGAVGTRGAGPAPMASSRPAAATSDPAKAPAAPLPQRVASGQTQAVPLSKMRATIATRLQQAKQQIPHIYVSIEVDVDSLLALREKLNKQLESQKIRISVNDLMIKACAVALQQNPGMNAIFDEKNNQIVKYGDVHIGNAVALPDGLIVANLRNADQMGLREIRVRSADLFDRAKQMRLKQDELMGHTFTISNLGAWGVTDFAAIVNPPAVGILAVAAAEKRAVVRGDQIVARSMMTLTLSADHRAVDGALAAEFLRTLKSLLEEPAMMLV